MKDLASSNLLQNSPWLIMGDFNQVLSISEAYYLSPTSVSLQGMEDMQNCLSLSGLFDLSYIRCFYTRTNKSESNPKSRKLDRALVIEALQDQFPDSNAFFDVPGSSDNSPCLVSLTNATVRKKSRFHFFLFYTTHPDYSRLMQQAWLNLISLAGPMFFFYQRLRAAKFYCKSLNQSTFSNIQ